MPDRFELECPRCTRKGFAWARPVCQYCGHVIDDVPEFKAVRERLAALAEEAEKASEKAKAETRRARPADGSIDVGGDLSTAP